MPDREKVIKGLECCVFPVSKGFPYQSHIADGGCEVIECPYRDDCDQLLLDALELLKEQEPIAPKLIKMYPHDIYECGNCGHRSVGSKDYKAKYCPECGQAVKWNEAL